MTTTAKELLKKNIVAQEAESPEADALIHKPGPKKRGNIEAGVQQILDGAAPYAAALLRDHVRKVRGVKTLKPTVQRAAEYIIDHAIGKSRQKIEHSGGIMTYGDLAKSAETLEKKPPPVLADAEEIAHKYQETNPSQSQTVID